LSELDSWQRSLARGVAPSTADLLVVMIDPGPPPARPGRRGDKIWLRDALEPAGIPVLSDPMDVAADLVTFLDPFRASKGSLSPGHFVDELGKALRRLGGSAGRVKSARPGLRPGPGPGCRPAR
jgi:hypothetical protein